MISLPTRKIKRKIKIIIKQSKIIVKKVANHKNFGYTCLNDMAISKECNISNRNCLLCDFFADIPRSVYLKNLANVETAEIRKVLTDPEDRRTAEIFLKCNLNINAASKELFMHRNTLIYRLDKIKEHTGLDLKKFCDAFIFHVLMFKDSSCKN